MSDVSKCPQTGKEIHLSKGVADAHLHSLKRIRPEYGGGAYHCEYCQGWHVGRQKKNAHRSKYGRG